LVRKIVKCKKRSDLNYNNKIKRFKKMVYFWYFNFNIKTAKKGKIKTHPTKIILRIR